MGPIIGLNLTELLELDVTVILIISLSSPTGYTQAAAFCLQKCLPFGSDHSDGLCLAYTSELSSQFAAASMCRQRLTLCVTSQLTLSTPHCTAEKTETQRGW